MINIALSYYAIMYTIIAFQGMYDKRKESLYDSGIKILILSLFDTLVYKILIIGIPLAFLIGIDILIKRLVGE